MEWGSKGGLYTHLVALECNKVSFVLMNIKVD